MLLVVIINPICIEVYHLGSAVIHMSMKWLKKNLTALRNWSLSTLTNNNLPFDLCHTQGSVSVLASLEVSAPRYSAKWWVSYFNRMAIFPSCWPSIFYFALLFTLMRCLNLTIDPLVSGLALLNLFNLVNVNFILIQPHQHLQPRLGD